MNLLDRVRAALVRPWIRAELPGWGYLYVRVAGGRDDIKWANTDRAVIIGKLHGYKMILDRANWSERLSFFLGRYYDLPSQLLLRLLTDAGDVVIDVGANNGMMMLTAAQAIGPTGVVICFEPNPRCITRIREHVALNRLTNVQVFPFALGDAEIGMQLSWPVGHTGTGYLSAQLASTDREQVEGCQVAVRVGDEVLASIQQVPRLMKIDVEGFEMCVLRGSEATIAKHRPIVMLELIENYLRRQGSSAAEVWGFLRELGYIGYSTGLKRGLLRHGISLRERHSEQGVDCSDVLFIHRDDERRERLNRYCSL